MVNVPDEVVLKDKEEDIKAKEESKRDRTFEEFQKTYLPHLEGKVDAAARTANRPETVPWNVDGGTEGRGQKTGMSRASKMDVVGTTEPPVIDGEGSVRKSVHKSQERSKHLGSTVHS